MPTKQEMLDRIAETIASKRKEYYKACPRCWADVHMEYWNHTGRPETAYSRYTCNKCWELTFEEDEELSKGQYAIREKPNPVMIGDVLDWMSKNFSEMNYESGRFSFVESVYIKRKELREPIEHQSDECIKFVYSLLPTK